MFLTSWREQAVPTLMTMDTRSSSGSASGSNNHTQGGGHPPPQHQQPRYTTAGTLYNPQTAAPLQPPARRGRAARWPPAVPADLSAFNNSILGNFSRGRLRSPPTTASTLRHYSPLQQNCDRAAHPPRSLPHERRDVSVSFLSMSLTHDQPIRSDKANSRQDQSTSLKGQENQDDKVQEGAVEEEEDEATRMSNYSVKTLTSLASYPNPYQKIAQRALDRARETFKAAAEASRPISPAVSRQGLDGAGVPSSSYSLGRESSDYSSRVPRNAHIKSSTRSSVLSSGPGAPQPLTAGPPGQRQYKVSTLEGPFRAIQAGTQKPPSSTADEAHFNINASSLLDMGSQSPINKSGPPHTPEQTKQLRTLGAMQVHQPSAQTPGAIGANYPWGRVYPPTHWHSEPQETRSIDQIKQYYPSGVAPHYNSRKLVLVPGDNSDLPLILHQHNRPHPMMGSEVHDETEVRHRVAIYSAIYDLIKSWDERLEDLRLKDRDKELGLSDSTARATARQAQMIADVSSSPLGEPEDIDVGFFNQMETYQAVQPLLRMAFSTLANYWDNGRLMGHPTGFDRVKKPEEDDLWARSRTMDNYMGQPQSLPPQSQSRWGLPHTPPPPSQWSGRSGDM